MRFALFIKIIDILSFVSLAFIVSTGCLLHFNLLKGSGPSTVWGLTRHQWGDIHWYVSLFFLTMLLMHLLTHLKYVKQVILGKAGGEQRLRIALGLLGLIALLTVALTPAVSPVQEVERNGHGRQLHRNLP